MRPRWLVVGGAVGVLVLVVAYRWLTGARAQLTPRARRAARRARVRARLDGAAVPNTHAHGARTSMGPPPAGDHQPGMLVRRVPPGLTPVADVVSTSSAGGNIRQLRGGAAGSAGTAGIGDAPQGVVVQSVTLGEVAVSVYFLPAMTRLYRSQPMQHQTLKSDSAWFWRTPTLMPDQAPLAQLLRHRNLERRWVLDTQAARPLLDFRVLGSDYRRHLEVPSQYKADGILMPANNYMVGLALQVAAHGFIRMNESGEEEVFLREPLFNGVVVRGPEAMTEANFALA